MMYRTFAEMRLSQTKTDEKLDKVAKLVGNMSIVAKLPII